MSENLFGLTVAADKGLDDLQCQRLLSENRRYQEVMLQYRCALKALESRLEILNEEFSLQHDRNPIESMKSRLKSPSSIMNKMQKRGLPLDFQTMQANIMDVAGVRVICSFEEDVFFLAKCLKKQSDIEIITEKDYISHPKPKMCIRDRSSASCGASFPVSRRKLLDRECCVTSFRQGGYTPLRR